MAKVDTTWLTSTDRVDHAVADEEFAAHRPEPAAMCGAVILLAPMEWPPGPRCARCTAFLAARESPRELPERLGAQRRHRRRCWLVRLVRRISTLVVARDRAPRDDRSPIAGGAR